MAKKPFPFKVCEQCCSGGGTGATDSGVGAMLEPTGAEAFNDYENNNSNIPYAHVEGRNNNATVKGFYITDYTSNTVTLDSVEGIEVGMPWYIFINTPEKQERYAGYVEAIDGNTVTVTARELPTSFTPSKTPSYFGTFFVHVGEIGTFEVTDTTGEFYVHLEGRGNKAFLDAHAEGTEVFAGYSSHAEGRKTKAVGQCSHAEGYGGFALQEGAHAEGAVCKANGGYSHAEGYYTETQERFAHSEGWETIAQGDAAHAEGYLTKASNQFAHAEGKSAIASGIGSHAEGNSTTASGKGSHAEGNSTTASGKGSHAEGNSTTASGQNSHAEGNSTTASGTNSHAEGGSTEASAYYAHAEGESTKATSNAAHAEGGGSKATALYAHAEGLWTIAASDSQHVEGRYNKEDASGKYAHIVGNGSGSGRSNAHTLDWDGNGWFAGSVEATAIILKSSTAGSKKRFKITVDDSGALHTEEIV